MRVLLFGLGHLGKKVVTLREFKTLEITATYRNKEKVEKFNDINLVKYELGDDLPPSFFTNYDIFIFNFPPRDQYLELLKDLHQNTSSQTSWFFVSSTSVFGEGKINEDSQFLGESENAKKLKLLESFIRNNRKDFLLIRPGGLVDNVRHPSNYLKHKELLVDSEREINFVHTDDVARFIAFCIKEKIRGEFNLVADKPIKRRTIYQKYYPDIKCDNEGSERRISNEKLHLTGFKLKYPDLSLFLKIV